jgi:Kef-type K+ transport system membrane component KefB
MYWNSLRNVLKGVEGIMESYKFLLDLALILLTTKVLGLMTRRMRMPQVVGALIAGLVLGPAMLNVITQTEYIKDSAEIGVIVLMFCAGMETDVHELKKSGKASFVIALIGVIVPLIGGYAVAAYFNQPGIIESGAPTSLFLQNVFIGVILTATSVSITVETLKEIGKLKTHSGNAILGAAIIDDILGIIALTVITSMADTSVSLGIVLLKIVGFFIFAAVAGYIFFKFFTKWAAKADKGLQRHAIIAFVFCLGMSYVAEEFFGVADITGAFIAGLIISMTEREPYIAAKFDTLSYLYLSPIFFASIGLEVNLPDMGMMVVWFAVALVVVAILSKIIGCGIGAKICGYKNYQCARIGVGMISRGEVALIVASKGEALGLIGNAFMGPVVLVVIITTIVTPIMLKSVFTKTMKYTPQGLADTANNVFARNYERIEDFQENGQMDGEKYEAGMPDQKETQK